MAFLSDVEAFQAVSNVLKTSSADLPDYWEQEVEAAHNYAYYQVVSRLKARGYTDTEISDWNTNTDQGKDFERRILIEEALTRGGMLGNYDDKFIRHLRRARLELDLLTLVT